MKTKNYNRESTGKNGRKEVKKKSERSSENIPLMLRLYGTARFVLGFIHYCAPHYSAAICIYCLARFGVDIFTSIKSFVRTLGHS